MGARGLKYVVMVEMLVTTTAVGETRLRPKTMEERLARIGAGELLGLWAERKAAVGKAGATVAPPSAEPEPEAPGHEDRRTTTRRGRAAMTGCGRASSTLRGGNGRRRRRGQGVARHPQEGVQPAAASAPA